MNIPYFNYYSICYKKMDTVSQSLFGNYRYICVNVGLTSHTLHITQCAAYIPFVFTVKVHNIDGKKICLNQRVRFGVVSHAFKFK